MAHTVLDKVSFGYEILWDRLRQIGGVELFVGDDPTAEVDAQHLLNALDELWSEQAPTLLLSAQTPRLLCDLLDHFPPDGPWLVIDQTLLNDPAVAQHVHQAHQRGLVLVWRGEPAARPSSALAPCFSRLMVNLTASEALAGLRVSLRQHNGLESNGDAPVESPVQANDIYESVASWVLAEHCLDQQGAWALAGWPAEDVLHQYRHQRIQPGYRATVRLIETIDADQSNEHIEQILGEEPILAYRFLRWVNSAGLGLRTRIESLHHGLMVVGLSRLRSWLLEQLPHSSSDLNLHPVRTAMVVRARLMEQLLDAGEGDDLRRDVYLCGLLSQIDLLLGESLQQSLSRVPVSEHITAALLEASGPYQPCLNLALAMESGDTQAVRALCSANQMDLESVNHKLLRTLCAVKPHPARGLLLV